MQSDAFKQGSFVHVNAFKPYSISHEIYHNSITHAPLASFDGFKSISVALIYRRVKSNELSCKWGAFVS